MFYYGHPAVLYVNKLRVAGLLQGPINEYFEGIFEVGESAFRGDLTFTVVSAFCFWQYHLPLRAMQARLRRCAGPDTWSVCRGV